MNKENTIKDYLISGKLNMEKLVKDFYNYILAIIKNTADLSKEDEEELISDVFFIIWKNQKSLKVDEKFSPYIAGITRNIVYKKYKENLKQRNIEEIKENTIPVDRLEDDINDVRSYIEAKDKEEAIKSTKTLNKTISEIIDKQKFTFEHVI